MVFGPVLASSTEHFFPRIEADNKCTTQRNRGNGKILTWCPGVEDDDVHGQQVAMKVDGQRG
jgi:hypothetical protein